MKILDALLLLILFCLLFVSMYLLWLNFPTTTTQFQAYTNPAQYNLPITSHQFYSNMRYPDSKISYTLASTCTAEKTHDFENAVARLEQATTLSFYETQNNPYIKVTCSNLAPASDDKSKIIAGEGGPSEIINATKFSIILAGQVALYRTETCPKPQIATHELLHAIGFDHNKNPKSIMYPVTSCDEELDQSIIDEINKLYAIPSSPDLLIETVSANKSGIYLNFEASIANEGLKKAGQFSLAVKSNNQLIKSFTVENLDIGTRRKITVTNLRVPYNTQDITFEVDTPEEELSKTNNIAEIKEIPNSG